MIKKIIRYIGYILFRPIWWLERLVPRNKHIWVFGAWYGQKYSDNSKWLYEYVLENEPKIRVIWITKNNNVYKKLKLQNKPVAMSTSIKGIWWCLRAKYALLTSGVVDVNGFALNGCRQIWLWHGMPLKKIGYSMNDKYSSFKYLLSKIINPYYYLSPYSTLTSSKFFNIYLEDAFNLKEKDIWETGLPRCDAFFMEKKELLIENIHNKVKGAKVLIYMPTFRMTSDMVGEPFNPFSSKYNFDSETFINFLKIHNIFFLYKPHYVDSKITVNINSDRFILLNDNMFDDLYTLLNSVDGLITDYSSVYFDFLSTKNVTFLLPFDYEEYINKSRGHFFNMYKELNCPFIANDWNSFYKNYDNYLEYGYMNSDDSKFASFLDGNSCKKVLEKVLEI